MRTNIVIDDKLMRDTLRATGLKTKREAVELGLRTLLRLRKQNQIRQLRGKINWQGDLDGGKGVTIRKTIDAIIATRCIQSDYELLHSDRDFDPFECYLGLPLVTARSEP